VIKKTPQEILDRIENLAGDDWLGRRKAVLVSALPYEMAAPLISMPMTADQWELSKFPAGQEDAYLAAYFGSVVGAVCAHNGLQAGRGVDSMDSWLWLTRDEDEHWRYVAAQYALFGAPKLLVAAEVLPGGMDVWNRARGLFEGLANMASGTPCWSGCDEGCRG
jgi:hypothetical protein